MFAEEEKKENMGKKCGGGEGRLLIRELVLFLVLFGKHYATIASCLIFYCGVYSIKLYTFWYYSPY